ncbi:TonB-dependent receptor plug domain-containing protein [Balneatrix alpica]|uniref:TonB-dependent receptor plug domain-containing protein n=1 Tax=Balneatrix alpica TaxID=75684 RepID=UPI002738C60A|nr:TonB-dependent receptor [Balneatrix alpica]
MKHSASLLQAATARPLFALAPLTLALLAAPVQANDQASDADVLVTASRLPQSQTSVGSSVTVITRAELEKRQVRTLADALRGAPGVNVFATSTPGSLTPIRLRGLHQRFTQVVIDGVPVNDPSNVENDMDIGTLQVADIERIEIVRGPQSALWGSDAIGGVVHIITRKGQGKPVTEIDTEVGSHGTQQISLSRRAQYERLGYAINVSNLHSNGFSAANEKRGASEADGIESRQASGSVSYQLTDSWKVSANLSHNLSTYDIDASWPTVSDNRDWSKAERNTLRLQSEWDLLGGDWQHRLGYSKSNTLRHQYTSFGGFFDGEREVVDYQTQYHFASDLFGGLENSVIFAAEHENESAHTGSINKSVSADSLALEYVANWQDTLSASLSHRLDNNHEFADEDSSRIALSWQVLDGTRLHSSYGTGVKNPSLNQLFGPWGGNANLQAQSSKGWDLGVSQQLGDWQLDLTWFDNRVDNLIGYTTGYFNVAGITRSQGVETSLRGALSEQLDLQASYTYTDVDNDAGDSNSLLRQPWHEAALNLDYRLGFIPAALNLDVHFKGRRLDTGSKVLPSYTLVNLGGRYELNETWQVHARVHNLFDRDYEELYGYGTSKRAFYAGVNARF